MNVDSTPLVSIVIPTRDRSAVLERCLISLAEQAYPHARFDVVVVDDRSTDRTPQVVADVRARMPDLRLDYHRSEANGANAARNTGIRRSSGDLICLIDDDVIVPPDWLSGMVDGVARFPSGGCYGGPMRLLLEGSPPRWCGREPLGVSELDLGPAPVETDYVWSGNMAIKRSTFMKIGPFIEFPRSGADEIWLQDRSRALGMPIIYLPEPWVWHIRTSDQLRLRTLLQARFSKGHGQALNSDAIGKPYDRRRIRRALLADLRHWIGARCAVGLLGAAQHGGRLVGMAEMWFRRSVSPRRRNPST